MTPHWIGEVTVLMGTPANKQLLAGAGLLTSEADQAGPNDLVIAVRAASAAEAQSALVQADAIFMIERRQALRVTVRASPRTLDSALRHLPSANLALISVPGRWAAVEARGALRRGLHTMLFSDKSRSAGAWVLPSNAQAARAAAMLVGQTPGRPPARAAVIPGSSQQVARGGISSVSENPTRVAELPRGQVAVVNLGLEAFALDRAGRDVAVVHVEWRPPAGGDPRLARLLAQLDGQ